jgi:hypothetical protein
MFRSPWKRLRNPPPTVDADMVFRRSRALLAELDETSGELLSKGSLQPRLRPEEMAVDVWVSDTVHAGSFVLNGRASIIVQIGVCYVVDYLPQFLAEVDLRGRDTPIPASLIDGFARWIDWAASLADKVELPVGGDVNPRESATYSRALAKPANIFILAHELAHLYVANAAEMRRRRHDWTQMTPQSRRRETEHTADLCALDATFGWVKERDPTQAGLSTSYLGIWSALHGISLLETYEPRLRPAQHPSALQRLAVVRKRALQVDPSIDQREQTLQRVFEVVSAPGLALANERRLAARARMLSLVNELNAGKVSERRVLKVVGGALLESHAEALNIMADSWRFPSTDPSGRVRDAFRQVLLKAMPMNVYNSFSNVYAACELEAMRPARVVKTKQAD